MNTITRIDNNKCAYLNPEKQNADNMLKPCINGPEMLAWPCVERELLDNDIFKYITVRPQQDNIPHRLEEPTDKNVNNDMFVNPNIEGFTNLGEQYVRPGDLRDGYFICPETGEIKQACQNCKYNKRTYGKSKEYNEADPCFPNRGVYGGINNKGETVCSCGSRGQYCGDNFTAEGGFYSDNIFIANIGHYDQLGKLSAF